ncbi:MAG: zf-HC2 domain-containing protein [Armatimonadetes bacterium]|nr:zf-HC2 domain-containing protein [Armatimonadota bacterium]CUU34609.1 Putative zinc-finger [Armatimonadetes bacterium DC]
MKPMACPEWEERLSLYVDGLLNPFEENAVEAHIARCEGCRATVSLWKAVGMAVRRLPTVSPPPDLRARILDCTTRRRPRPLVWLPRGWQLAPVLGLGLLLAWLSLTPTTESLISNTSYQAAAPAPTTPQATVLPQPPTPPPPVEEGAAVPQVIISVKTSPSFRVSPNTPRWVGTTRLSPVEPHLPDPVPPQAGMVSVSQPTPPSPIVTEVADTPYEPLPASSGHTDGKPGAPRSQNETPRPTLAEWSQQFYEQLRREQRARSGIAHSPNAQRYIPIVSIRFK